jgi:thioredoxin reductase
LVPTVEELMVTGVDTARDGFELRLANGTMANVSNVIVATGLEHAAYIPPELTGLPRELLSHSSEHHDLSRFEGMDVTVIGGGQSALETAALLSEEGASVRLVVRKPSLEWNSTPTGVRPSLFHRLRYPQSGLGEGLELWLCSTAPMLFRHLPSGIRLERVKAVLGPAGAWWLKERVLGRVQVLLDHSVSKAETKGSKIVLSVAGQDGRTVDISSDHVIAATGYRFDVQRLPFLSRSLKTQLCIEHHRPVLSSAFETSVPGLFFTGLASATSFGPSMRFLYGAHFTARRVARHIVAEQRQSSSRPMVRYAYALKRSGS